MNGEPTWIVPLIGGPSGVGTTTLAREAARRLESSRVLVDDLRLALARSGVRVPDADALATFDAPGGLVDLGERLTPAIEVVIENHVDQRDPEVIEGDSILPSLFDRPAMRHRTTRGRARAVFLHEANEDALFANMRGRRVGPFSREHARKNFLYGQWLRQEAERRALPIVPAHPWDSLADRILIAGGLSPENR
jgi:2-phosphoglycerate kinase